MLIRNHDDFVVWLTGLVTKKFPGPRLTNPRAKIAENAAARSLVEAGYKASRVKGIWLFAQQHSFFASKINSTQALAAALLTPPNPNWLEADYDVWLAAHPPMCAHGRPLENKVLCPGCNADPNCPHHCVDGVITERVLGVKDLFFICDCVAAKIGKPSLEEQIRIESKKREKNKRKIEPDEVL